ncbi:hypothetical protein [Clostridium sp. B9]|uniref:hypothetical protein n=1 Tax=Clostridium sp. B9 TaxID=3423224 RepID=UPI003D2EE418
MSLCKGQVKIGRKKIKRGSWRFFCKRYLKRNYNFVESEFKNRHKYEILENIKIDNLDFNVDIEFNGVKPKEIELRSIDNVDNHSIELYKNWVGKELNIDMVKNTWSKRSFKWGNISVKLTKISEQDIGCLTLKIRYK